MLKRKKFHFRADRARHCDRTRSGDAYWVLSVFEVVFVPSLCWVVEVVLEFPLGSAADVVVVFFDGSLCLVMLLVCPFGFSVVVVFEVD